MDPEAERVFLQSLETGIPFEFDKVATSNMFLSDTVLLARATTFRDFLRLRDQMSPVVRQMTGHVLDDFATQASLAKFPKNVFVSKSLWQTAPAGIQAALEHSLSHFLCQCQFEVSVTQKASSSELRVTVMVPASARL